MKLFISHAEFAANLETFQELATGFSANIDTKVKDFRGMTAAEFYTKYPDNDITITEDGVVMEMPENVTITCLGIVTKYGKMLKPWVKVIIGAFEASNEILAGLSNDLSVLFSGHDKEKKNVEDADKARRISQLIEELNQAGGNVASYSPSDNTFTVFADAAREVLVKAEKENHCSWGSLDIVVESTGDTPDRLKIRVL